jgi:hypothetical protein
MININFMVYRRDARQRLRNNETTAVARQSPVRIIESAVGGGVFYVVRSEAISRDRLNFVVSLKGLGAKMNCLMVSRQSKSNSDS